MYRPVPISTVQDRGPSARSSSESERSTCVDERCTIVTSAPASHRAAQMSWAELFDPMTTAFLPA